MPTYELCGQDVLTMADELLRQYPSHKPLIEAGVKIDFVFAYPKYDKNDMAVGDALRLHGKKALGIARILPLKQRSLGRGDCEVSLDGEWWNTATEPEKRALLDHELHHFEVRMDGELIKKDDHDRPMLKMRQHDYDVGWFTIIAHRHGLASAERQQARQIMEESGQYFWPDVEGESVANTSAGVRKENPERQNVTFTIGPREAAMLKKAAGQLEKLAPSASFSTAPDALDEELVAQCAELIITEQKASVSFLQRRLRLGYTRAAKIMDALEARGLVGPSKGAEPREILSDVYPMKQRAVA